MSFSCPTAFSDGPCFTLAKNWTDAQRICESHGSNLATITDAMANDQYGENGCFSNAPWNDWKCSWVGANDLKTEGAWVWPGGEAWNFTSWGASEPDTGDDQDCAAVCKGGTVPAVSQWQEETRVREARRHAAVHVLPGIVPDFV